MAMNVLAVSNAKKRYGSTRAVAGASLELRLDGYLKVFWRNAPVWELWPQVLVLGGLGTTFMLLARLLARRWEVG